MLKDEERRTFKKLVVGGSRGKNLGSYVPAHRIAGKTDVSGSVRFTAYNNGQKLTADGKWVDDNELLEFIAWDSKTSEKALAGNGFAPLVARHLAVGTTFSCTAINHPYMKTARDSDGTVLMMKNGQPFKYKCDCWSIEPLSISIDTLKFSAEQIAIEIAEYNRRKTAGMMMDGMVGFDIRPPRWNSTDPDDAVGIKHVADWKAILEYRRTKKYTGGATFGFMKVWLPDGATMLNVPDGASLTNDVETGGTPMPPPGSTLAKTRGCTYAQYKAAGWTDPQMIAFVPTKPDDPDFSIFIQSGELITTPMAPPVPDATSETTSEAAANVPDEMPI